MTRSARVSLLALLIGVMAMLPAAPCRAADDVTIEAPIVDEQIDLGDLVRELYGALELDPPTALEWFSWPIKPASFSGRAQLRALDVIFGDVATITRERERVVLEVDPAALGDAAEAGRESLQAWLDSIATRIQALQPDRRVWGLTIERDGRRIPIADHVKRHGALPKHAVVLIHGLDDPGTIWNELVGPLESDGHAVLRLAYPNDGPIERSARFVLDELRNLREAGVSSIDIVGHSMGGLVAREALTRDSGYAGTGEGDGTRPVVRRFILCGTPNQGSELARLRAVSELREQFTRLIGDGGGALGGLADGDGEAARDLLPGSAFLETLNARPLATGVDHRVIAGRASPMSSDDVRGLMRTVRDLADDAGAPAWLRRWIGDADRGAQQLLNEAEAGLGDGCVTIESATLKGASEMVIVDANHLSMLYNPLDRDGVPPAIPVIRRWLAIDADAPTP